MDLMIQELDELERLAKIGKAKYEDDKMYCFVKGTTSWSNDGEVSAWTYVKLYERQG